MIVGRLKDTFHVVLKSNIFPASGGCEREMLLLFIQLSLVYELPNSLDSFNPLAVSPAVLDTQQPMIIYDCDLWCLVYHSSSQLCYLPLLVVLPIIFNILP